MKSRVILCFLFVLSFSVFNFADEKKEEAPVLISAYGTSYSETSFNAVSLLDPSAKGYWQPESKDFGASEGVYFQFKDPVFVSFIEIIVEGEFEKKDLSFQLYLDGQTQVRPPSSDYAAGERTKTVFYDIGISNVKNQNGNTSFYIKENENSGENDVVRDFYISTKENGYSNLNYAAKSIFLKIKDAKILPKVKSVKIFGKDEHKPLNIELPLSPKAAVAASSVLKPEIAYSPEKLFDSQLDMAWSTNGKDTDGIGQSITVTFDSKKEIGGIIIWNGYQRSEAHYNANSRVKQLDINGQIVHVKDEKTPQTILFTKPVTSDKITLTIKDIYKSSKYKDVLISELRFITSDGKIILPQAKTAFEPLSKTDILKKDVTYANLIYAVDLIFPGPSYHLVRGISDTLRLRSNGSFVLYKYGDFNEDIGASDISEGNWEETGGKQMRLFGKKYRVIPPTVGADYLRRVNDTTLKPLAPVIFQSNATVAQFNSLTKAQKEEALKFILNKLTSENLQWFFSPRNDDNEAGLRITVRSSPPNNADYFDSYSGYYVYTSPSLITILEQFDPIYIKSDIYTGLMVPYDQDIGIAEMLLEAKTNPNAQNNDKRTALLLASIKGQNEIVKMMLSAKADPNIQDIYGKTALIWASESGYKTIVGMLLKAKVDPDIQDSDGKTALIYALEKGHKEVAVMLLNAKADPNIQYNGGKTALIWASESGYKTIVGMLLKVKADPNIQDKNGTTALMLASENGRTETIEILLKAKADVNIQNGYGGTALILASENGYKEIVEMLLAAKANPNLRDMKNNTALDYAIIKNDYKEIVDILKKAEEYPNNRNLFVAVEKGNVKITSDIVNAGVNPNMQNKKGETGLMIASKKGYKEIVELLLKVKADPNIQDRNGTTALMFASENGYKEIADILKKAGAK